MQSHTGVFLLFFFCSVVLPDGYLDVMLYVVWRVRNHSCL